MQRRFLRLVSLMKISRRGRVFNKNNRQVTKSYELFKFVHDSSWQYIDNQKEKLIALLVFFSTFLLFPARARSQALSVSRYIKRKKLVTSWKGNRISVDNGAPNAIHFSINMIRIVDPDGWSASVTPCLLAYTRFTFRLRSTKKCKFVNDTTPTDSSSRKRVAFHCQKSTCWPTNSIQNP